MKELWLERCSACMGVTCLQYYHFNCADCEELSVKLSGIKSGLDAAELEKVNSCFPVDVTPKGD